MRGVSERGPAVNQVPHQIHNWASINEVWVLVLGFFIFLSAVSSGLSLVLDPGGRLGSLEGKMGSACEEFEDSESGI